MSGIVSSTGGPLSAGGLYSTVWPPKTSAYTAAPSEMVLCDTTGGAFTVTLPTAPDGGTLVGVKLVAQTGTNAVTVACGSGDAFNLPTGPTSGTVATLNQLVLFQYRAGVGVWVGMDHLALSSLDLRYAQQTATAATAPKVVALTDATTIAVNAALGNDFRVTLGGNRTMGAPTNPADGQVATFQITQDGTGSRTVTWNAAFDFGAGSAPTLSTAAGKVDVVRFVYNATLTKWLYLGSSLGN